MSQPETTELMQAEVSRVSSFSDNVISIAITLLVLSLTVPELSQFNATDQLLSKLIEMWPKMFFYVISFLGIGVFWVNHHEFFKSIRKVDTNLKFINLFHLLNISFLPFPTAVMGRYPSSAIAASFFALCMGLCGISELLLFLYVHKKGYSSEKPKDTYHVFIMPIAFLLSIPFTFMNSVIVEAFWVLFLFVRIFVLR